MPKSKRCYENHHKCNYTYCNYAKQCDGQDHNYNPIIDGHCIECGGTEPNESRPYQPKTGATCGCKPGVQRDNCPACEGTGLCIDFKAIREARTLNLTSNLEVI